MLTRKDLLLQNMSTTLRWGIASAGKISHDFCVALSTLPSDEHQIVAVGARSLDRAQEFAQKHGIPKAFGSYLELAKCEDVDIVYIGALNPQHYELGFLFLELGKHLLVEKPLCMNLQQAKRLIQYAESRKLFLMEAVWSRFFPAYQYVRRQIDTGVLGEIQEVEAAFGFPLSHVDRLQKKDLGGGVVLDLGIYTIQCAQWAFQEPPQKVLATGKLNDEGVETHVDCELIYSGGRKAKLVMSDTKQVNTAIIKGTKGQITLVDFWCPTKIIDIDGKVKEWVLPKGKLETFYMNSEGLRYEAEAVRLNILEGKDQNATVSHNDSLLFAQIEDEIRGKLNVEYQNFKL